MDRSGIGGNHTDGADDVCFLRPTGVSFRESWESRRPCFLGNGESLRFLCPTPELVIPSIEKQEAA